MDADKQKHLRWLSGCDDVQTVEHAVGGVAADAAVLGMRIAEQLSPLTTVGDAVAQEYDVVLACRQCLEESGALVIECGVLALLSLHGRAEAEEADKK